MLCAVGDVNARGGYLRYAMLSDDGGAAAAAAAGYKFRILVWKLIIMFRMEINPFS